MLFRELITGYSENHMKPKHTLRGQNAELLNVKQVAHKLPLCIEELKVPHPTCGSCSPGKRRATQQIINTRLFFPSPVP
jgi:hypothetical protein